MIGIGKKAPEFTLAGALKGMEQQFSLSDFRGTWIVLFFYPADFTFICPTEVLGFEKRFADFDESDARILGISVDSVETHLRWAQEIGGVGYPLLSDNQKKVSRLYNVLDEDEGVAERATFIIDPDVVVNYEMASALNVGRSVEETYRVLKALQSGRLCPADWKPGEATGDLSLKY